MGLSPASIQWRLTKPNWTEKEIRKCVVAVKKILYIDMDNVLVDFQSALPHYPPEVLKEHEGDLDETTGKEVMLG